MTDRSGESDARDGDALRWRAVGAVRRFLADPEEPVPRAGEDSEERLARVLLDHGWVLPAQLEAILGEVEARRAAGGEPLGAYLLRNNIVSMARLGYALQVVSGERDGPGRDAPAASRIGRFPLLAELGRGGMGVVYRAVDPQIKREVALKVLPPASGDPHAAKRLLREASAIGRLRHPHVVHVYEIGEADGKPYIAMELLEGPSLAEVFRTEIPLKDRVRMIVKVARAVAFAHRYGVVHRDLKPENIKLGADGEPKVMDFGLASLDGGTADITRPGTVMGTPSYMAPEQVRGEWVGPPADVYALGVILYVAATGTVPFKGKTAQEAYARILEQEPVPPRRLNPQVSPDLEAVCLKALEKSEARRYPGAADFADDLDRFLEFRPVVARKASPLERAWKRIRRQPVAWGLAAILTLSVASGSLLWVRNILADHHAAQVRSELEGTQMVISTLEDRLTQYQEDHALAEIFDGLAEAERGLVRLLEQDPGEGMGWVLLGDLHRLRHNSQAAVDAYSAVIDASGPATGPLMARALLGRALARIADSIGLGLVQRDFRPWQDDDRSRELADLAVQDIERIGEGLLPEPLRELAAAWSEQLNWQRGDPDAERRLIEICDVQIRNGGRNHWFYFIRSLHSPTEEALRLCETALDKARGEVLIAYWLGALQFRLDRVEECIRTYSEVIRLQPDSPDGYFDRANALQRAGRLEEALADLEAAIALDPDLPWLYLNRGTILAQQGNREAALAEFDRVVQLSPESPLGWSNRAAMLAITGRLGEARASVDEALRLDEDYAQALVQSARIWISLNEMGRAAGDAQRALDSIPDYEEAWLLLGMAQLYQSKLEEAAEALGQAVELNPRDAEAHEMLGVTMLNLRRDEESLAALDESVRLRPDRASPYHYRGILLSASDLRAAMEDFSSAIERDDGWGMPYYRRGLVRRELGDLEGAIADFRAALSRRILANEQEIRAALEAAEREAHPDSTEY